MSMQASFTASAIVLLCLLDTVSELVSTAYFSLSKIKRPVSHNTNVTHVVHKI